MTASITLRDYQQDAIDAIQNAYQSGQRRVLITLPTGAGKTVVFGHLVQAIVQGGGRALVLAHTEELIDQAARTLRSLLPDRRLVGIVRAQEDEVAARVVIATVQTLRNGKRLEGIGQFDLIVIDEAHHAVAGTYQRILQELGAFDPGRRTPLVLGVTATADRGDGQGLDDIFESVAFTVGIDEMIRRGYLSDVLAKRVSLNLNLDRVQRYGGDFADGALGAAMIAAGAPDMIAAAIQQYAPDRKSVVFLPTVDLAEQTADAIRALGISARAVSGQTPKEERQGIIADIRAGRLRVVTNCMVLTEGFDAPVLDCAVMARPTSSRALYQQSAGRVLRPFIGKKDALILDVVGVTQRHSFHTAASLIDAFPAGEQIYDDETAMEALQRVQEAQAASPDAFSLADGRLVAVDVDLFDRSQLNWITNVVSFPILSGARTAYAIRIGDSDDACELFRLDTQGYGYGVARLADGLSLDMAQGMAEDEARRSGFDPTTLKGQEWRNTPPTQPQLRKLWMVGLRDQHAFDGIRTKGEASDMITQLMAELAIKAYDAEKTKESSPCHVNGEIAETARHTSGSKTIRMQPRERRSAPSRAVS